MVDVQFTANDIETKAHLGDKNGLAKEMNMLTLYDTDTINAISLRLEEDHTAKPSLPDLRLSDLPQQEGKTLDGKVPELFGRDIELHGNDGKGNLVSAQSDWTITQAGKAPVTRPAVADISPLDLN